MTLGTELTSNFLLLFTQYIDCRYIGNLLENKMTSVFQNVTCSLGECYLRVSDETMSLQLL
jgi:hypothetical protein